MEKKTNRFLIFNLGVLFFGAATMAAFNYWHGTTSKSHWYIYREETKNSEQITM